MWECAALARAAAMSWLGSFVRKAREVAGEVYQQQSALAREQGTRAYVRGLYSQADQLARVAVRGVAGRLTGRLPLADAVLRFERTARSQRGADRTATARRWLAALKTLDPATAEAADAAAAEAAAEAGATEVPPLGQQPEDGDEASAGEDVGASDDSPARTAEEEERAAVARVANVVYYEEAPDGESALTCDFRGALLRSTAIEELALTYVLELWDSPEEAAVLEELLSRCLLGGEATAKLLVSHISALAAAAAMHEREVLASKDDLHAAVLEGVGAVKCDACLEMLSVKLAHLADARTAASAQLPHPVEVAEDAEPGAASESAHAVAGGAAAATELLRASVEQAAIASEHVAMITSSVHSAAARSDALAKLDKDLDAEGIRLHGAAVDVRRQTEEATAFQTSKLAEMSAASKALAEETTTLEARKAALEAELADVTARLAAAAKKRQLLDEERLHFDESNSDVNAVLEGSAEDLQLQLKHHASEKEAVVAWLAFLGAAEAARAEVVTERAAVFAEAEATAVSQCVDACRTFLEVRERDGQMLLNRLRFCAGELAAMREKQARMTELGMASIAAELTSGQLKLENKYLEAESDLKSVLFAARDARAKMTGVKGFTAAYEEALDSGPMRKIDQLEHLFDELERPELTPRDTEQAEDVAAGDVDAAGSAVEMVDPVAAAAVGPAGSEPRPRLDSGLSDASVLSDAETSMTPLKLDDLDPSSDAAPGATPTSPHAPVAEPEPAAEPEPEPEHEPEPVTEVEGTEEPSAAAPPELSMSAKKKAKKKATRDANAHPGTPDLSQPPPAPPARSVEPPDEEVDVDEWLDE